MKFDFVANLKDGVLPLRFMENIARYLKTLPDGPVRVRIEKYKRTRSDQQNRYYWKVVVRAVAEHTGYTDDEAHEALKMKFLRKTAEGMPDTVQSTAKLNTAEFEAYLESVRRWAAMECHIYIPDPNEDENIVN